jgi:hypothetical protein
VEGTKASGYAASSVQFFSGTQFGLNVPLGIAIDYSGDVWVSNSGISVQNNLIDRFRSHCLQWRRSRRGSSSMKSHTHHCQSV